MGGGGSAPRPGRFYPRERHGTHFTGDWVGPMAGMEGRKISSPSGFDPGTSSPYSVAIPTELPGPHPHPHKRPESGTQNNFGGRGGGRLITKPKQSTIVNTCEWKFWCRNSVRPAICHDLPSSDTGWNETLRVTLKLITVRSFLLTAYFCPGYKKNVLKQISQHKN